MDGKETFLRNAPLSQKWAGIVGSDTFQQAVAVAWIQFTTSLAAQTDPRETMESLANRQSQLLGARAFIAHLETIHIKPTEIPQQRDTLHHTLE